MEFLLLGTIHLNENTDLVQLGQGELLKFREEEFEQLVNELRKFAPEQIFVEFPVGYQQQLDKEYEAYLTNESPLGHNEVYQIAFRLAKKLHHDRVYTVDWNEEIPNLKGLEDIQDKSALQQILGRGEELMKQITEKIRSTGIIETFQFINSNELDHLNHQIYIDLMQLDDEIAFNWVANYWYYRNLRIVKNIMAAKKDGAKKGLILYGFGHNYLLKQQLQEIEGITVKSFGE